MIGQPPREPFDSGWKMVVCADCGRGYQCRPEDDYYHRPEVLVAGAETLTNGVCWACLLKPHGLENVPVIDLTKRPRG